MYTCSWLSSVCINSERIWVEAAGLNRLPTQPGVLGTCYWKCRNARLKCEIDYLWL